jgi:hypothetical protein
MPKTVEIRELRQVSYVTGDVTADGSAILLRVETEEEGPIDLSFPTVDLQHLVTLLLMLGGKAAVNGRFAAFSETFQTQPLPLHGVSLGVENDNQGVLTVEVGAAILSFSLPRSSMAEIGRTILTLTGSSAIAARTAN